MQGREPGYVTRVKGLFERKRDVSSKAPLTTISKRTGAAIEMQRKPVMTGQNQEEVPPTRRHSLSRPPPSASASRIPVRARPDVSPGAEAAFDVAGPQQTPSHPHHASRLPRRTTPETAARRTPQHPPFAGTISSAGREPSTAATAAAAAAPTQKASPSKLSLDALLGSPEVKPIQIALPTPPPALASAAPPRSDDRIFIVYEERPPTTSAITATGTGRSTCKKRGKTSPQTLQPRPDRDAPPGSSDRAFTHPRVSTPPQYAHLDFMHERHLKEQAQGGIRSRAALWPTQLQPTGQGQTQQRLQAGTEADDGENVHPNRLGARPPPPAKGKGQGLGKGLGRDWETLIAHTTKARSSQEPWHSHTAVQTQGPTGLCLSPPAKPTAGAGAEAGVVRSPLVGMYLGSAPEAGPEPSEAVAGAGPGAGGSRLSSPQPTSMRLGLGLGGADLQGSPMGFEGDLDHLDQSHADIGDLLPLRAIALARPAALPSVSSVSTMAGSARRGQASQRARGFTSPRCFSPPPAGHEGPSASPTALSPTMLSLSDCVDTSHLTEEGDSGDGGWPGYGGVGWEALLGGADVAHAPAHSSSSSGGGGSGGSSSGRGAWLGAIVTVLLLLLAAAMRGGGAPAAAPPLAPSSTALEPTLPLTLPLLQTGRRKWPMCAPNDTHSALARRHHYHNHYVGRRGRPIAVPAAPSSEELLARWGAYIHKAPAWTTGEGQRCTAVARVSGAATAAVEHEVEKVEEAAEEAAEEEVIDLNSAEDEGEEATDGPLFLSLPADATPLLGLALLAAAAVLSAAAGAVPAGDAPPPPPPATVRARGLHKATPAPAARAIETWSGAGRSMVTAPVVVAAAAAAGRRRR